MYEPFERRALFFSACGHFFFHYFAAMYFTLAVALVAEWRQPFHELIALWTPATILIGLAALPAGRLADRWSAPGMLVVLFIGMGLFTAACGLALGPRSLLLLLAGIGLFGAIYHPVGIPWLIRCSRRHTGKKLALNGLFGGLGAAAAGAVSGLLVESIGWRGAFALPGLLCVAVGLCMAWLWRSGGLIEGRAERGAEGADASPRGRSKQLRGFLLMLAPMFVIGLVYAAVQGLLPKLFEERAAADAINLSTVGFLVGGVYTVAAALQLVGGALADRYAPKTIYLGFWLCQLPLLLLMPLLTALPLFVVAMALVSCNTAALPAENLLLSRFTPASRHGLAFGIKFVLAFGAGPLAVQAIAWVRGITGSFDPLLLGLAALTLPAIGAALWLPRLERRAPVAAVAK